ncbi:hypothetical protein QDY72_10600 [Kingella negevensis]|nr:hypothetical protein [Kingella negevensis]MDK4685598.1 hypothetical protein [Kingella negevensis]MDK4708767.1 hypothetical protein [Kingella negevensis]MDK4710974.1 hypothetical protein [Kingella negevensis]
MSKKFILAACSFEVTAKDGRIQLLPYGEFRAVDGRPTDATREILPTFCKINPLTIYFIPCNKVSNPAYYKQDFLQLCKLSNLIASYYHKPKASCSHQLMETG